MTNLDLTVQAGARSEHASGLLHRVAAACRRVATIAGEVSLERRELRRHRSLRTLDRRLLVDLGLDRSAC